MADPTGVIGARLYTSATPMVDIDAAADTIGDFQGLTIATEIGLIDNFGDIGRMFQTVNFEGISDGRTRKLKGMSNDGQFVMTFGQDLTDAGQAALKAYGEALNQNNYPFKMVWVGAPASFDTTYFAAKVMDFKTTMGGGNSVIKGTVTLELNCLPITGAS